MCPAARYQSLSGVITSEDRLVETPGLDLLTELSWTHANLMDEEPGPGNPTGRLSFRELVLPARLRAQDRPQGINGCRPLRWKRHRTACHGNDADEQAMEHHPYLQLSKCRKHISGWELASLRS